MKARRIIGAILIILFVPFVALGIWAFASGINSENINYIVVPLFGLFLC